jgi:alkylation response protein AidB-like acyl-CoA dehydrogenase
VGADRRTRYDGPVRWGKEEEENVDFEFNEEQKLLREMVRRFADQEIRPLAREIDRNEQVPKPLLSQAAELGLLGVVFPEEYGGGGLGETGYCIVLEEVARACASTATVIGGHQSIGAMALHLFGDEALKQRYLPRLARGELIAAFALSEAEAGSDAGALRTEAKPDGDGWRLSGAKTWITNGNIADVMAVFAVTDRARGSRGISAFWIETAWPGFRVGKPEDKMGIRGSGTVSIYFDDVAVPKENILGKTGDGFKIAMRTLECGRLTLAASCLGQAKEALRVSLEYAKQRVAFGKPIAQHQAVQAMLADMATDVYLMESAVYRTAWLADQGRPFGRESSIAKLFCSEALDRVVDKGLQIHGGVGYTREYEIERLYRDSRINRIFEGTSEIQRIVIASDLLKRGAEPD